MPQLIVESTPYPFVAMLVGEEKDPARSPEVLAHAERGDRPNGADPACTEAAIERVAGVFHEQQAVLLATPFELIHLIGDAVEVGGEYRCQPGPALFIHGTRIEVAANIGSIKSAHTALEFGADGVGLLRTEFLFLGRASIPDEEEQYAVYRALATLQGARPLIIRTLDIGGDKSIRTDHSPSGQFPGWRGIRVSLAGPEQFKTQLRAILRAGLGCNVKLLFPMITGVNEIHAARRLLDEARSELRERGSPIANPIEVGIMIEVPAAALSAATLAREVDFLSIGTNDLIQLTLAVDRTNERIAYLYDPLHPAVLRLIQMVIDGAHRMGKWVGLCGEMASLPEAVPLLVGLGLDEFSVNEASIPAVKQLIRSLDREAMRGLALRALELPGAAEIRSLLRSVLPG